MPQHEGAVNAGSTKRDCIAWIPLTAVAKRYQARGSAHRTIGRVTVDIAVATHIPAFTWGVFAGHCTVHRHGA